MDDGTAWAACLSLGMSMNRKYFDMLREHVNDIRSRWSPKERRGSVYDPNTYIETPEQARKLLSHLKQKLRDAERKRDYYLAEEIAQSLEKIEIIARRFFRWEESLTKTLKDQDMREIKNLPIRF